MNINSGNRSVSNHLIPYNAMNINTITNSMLGKRKANKTIYERAKKRKDLTMIAEVGRITNDRVNIRLPKILLMNSKESIIYHLYKDMNMLVKLALKRAGLDQMK
jgi:hypothetical protein